MKILNARVLIVAGLIASAVALTAGSVVAAKGNSGETKPGWGYGDKNHAHFGPQGQSVRPDKGEKPGWGYGDHNHAHLGPGGSSVRPTN